MASVHAAGERAVQLVWEALPAAADGLQPTAYEIHAAEQPPLWRLLRTVAADEAAAVGDAAHLVCTCDAPRARRTYYYTVRAVNAAGAGGLCHDNRRGHVQDDCSRCTLRRHSDCRGSLGGTRVGPSTFPHLSFFIGRSCRGSPWHRDGPLGCSPLSPQRPTVARKARQSRSGLGCRARIAPCANH